MNIEPFAMERFQSLWENVVDYNLSESGVHPFRLNELLTTDELQQLMQLHLGYNQTNGSEELRSLIAHLYADATPQHVLVTNGSAEANFISTWCLLQPGDEIALMLPNYMQIGGIAKAFGAQVKPFHLIPQNGRWQIDEKELQRSITPRTRLIAICNPNNPTGAQLDSEVIETICVLAAKANAYILSDEVYRGAERTGEMTTTFWDCYDRVIVVGGLSKAYGLPGLRIGWIVAPPEIIEKLWSYHDYTTICPNPISDYLATRALKSPQRERILYRNRKILENNFHMLVDWLQRHQDIFEYIPPQAGAIALIKYHLKIKSLDFVTRLREQKSVLVVPGAHFLMEYYLRIGFGGLAEHLKTALNRISIFIEEIQKQEAQR